jgi:hypothetical protein
MSSPTAPAARSSLARAVGGVSLPEDPRARRPSRLRAGYLALLFAPSSALANLPSTRYGTAFPVQISPHPKGGPGPPLESLDRASVVMFTRGGYPQNIAAVTGYGCQIEWSGRTTEASSRLLAARGRGTGDTVNANNVAIPHQVSGEVFAFDINRTNASRRPWTGGSLIRTVRRVWRCPRQAAFRPIGRSADGRSKARLGRDTRNGPGVA